MADYTSLPDEKMNRGYLLSDQDFINDLYSFNAGRNNEFHATHEEAFDAYLEHWRKSSVDEKQIMGDLQYAQDSDNKTKTRLRNLSHVFDRIESFEGKGFLSERGMQAGLDYLEGLGQSPSTWISLLASGGYSAFLKKRGGLGKRGLAAAKAMVDAPAAQLTRIQAMGIGLRSLLKAAAPAMVVEGTTGGLHGAWEGQFETEIGRAPEGEAVKRAAIGVPLGVVGGAAEGLPVAIMAARKGRKFAKVAEEGDTALARSREEAIEQTKKVLSSPKPKDKRTINWADKQLRALDAAKVEAGILIKKELGPDGEELVAGLSRETVDGIKAAAVEIAERVGFNSGDPLARITERVSAAVADGTLDTIELRKIALKYDLNMEDLSHLFMAEVSEAARTLRSMRTVKHFTTQSGRDAREAATNKRNSLQKTLHSMSPTSVEEVEYLTRIGSMGKRANAWMQEANKFRLRLMTSQFTTTIRNMENVGLRLPLHMIEYVLTGTENSTIRKRLASAAKIPFDLFDKASGDIFAEVYKEAVGEKGAQRLFRAAMDTATSVNPESSLAKAGRAVNVLNTFVDNAVKKTVLLAEIRKIAGGTAELNEIIRKGKLKEFLLDNHEAHEEAIAETLHLVYQKSYSPDSFAGKFINTVAHSNLAPLWTSVIPFPRYLANQTEFIYRHMPIIGMISPLLKAATPGKKLGRGELQKRLAQQVTGMSMLGTAYQIKLTQGPEVAWNHYVDDQGKTHDITALLGPFAPFMFAADLIYRMSEGTNKYAIPLIKTKEDVRTNLNKVNLREAFKAFSGIQSRVGTGLYITDRLIQDVAMWAADLGSDETTKGSDAAEKIAAGFAANYLNTFTIPVGMFRDLQASFDPEGRKIMDTDRVDLGRYFFNQLLRTFPNTEAMRNTEKFFGQTGLGLRKDSDLLQAGRGDQIELTFPTIREGRTRFLPFRRQTTGTTLIMDRKGTPLIDKELFSLGLARQDYIRRWGNADMNREYKRQMGIIAERELEPLITSSRYRNKSINLRREEFKDALGPLKQRAKENARSIVSRERPHEVAAWEYTAMHSTKRRAIAKRYQLATGKSLSVTEDYLTALQYKKPKAK